MNNEEFEEQLNNLKLSLVHEYNYSYIRDENDIFSDFSETIGLYYDGENLDNINKIWHYKMQKNLTCFEFLRFAKLQLFS